MIVLQVFSMSFPCRLQVVWVSFARRLWSFAWAHLPPKIRILAQKQGFAMQNLFCLLPFPLSRVCLFALEAVQEISSDFFKGHLTLWDYFVRIDPSCI